VCVEWNDDVEEVNEVEEVEEECRVKGATSTTGSLHSQTLTLLS
jgi:hypothetical protein